MCVWLRGLTALEVVAPMECRKNTANSVVEENLRERIPRVVIWNKVMAARCDMRK